MSRLAPLRHRATRAGKALGACLVLGCLVGIGLVLVAAFSTLAGILWGLATRGVPW